MTYIINDNGDEIVVSNELTITKQVLTFFDFKIKGNFSTNFDIPNTSVNRKALGYYGVNQSTKAAFSRQQWSLYKNGNFYSRGFLVIQEETQTNLNCFFASGNASWINLLSGNLKELNWSSYDQDLTYSNLSTLKTATTGMVFPLCDWGYQFNKGNHLYQARALYDASGDQNKFVYDFYPCFFIKTIVQEIGKQKEFKITGNIFDDPTFDKMVIPLPYIDGSLGEEIYMTDNDTYAGAQYIAGGATQTITFAYANNTDSLVSTSTGRIQNDGRSRNFRIRLAFQFDSAFTGSVLLRKNGSTLYTYNFTVASFVRYQTLTLAAGDYLDVQITNSSGFTRSVTDKYFGYQLCGSWYESGLKILAADVVPNTAIVEILKYITQAFNCIIDFNDFTQTITINKIDSIRKENATDLTDTVVDYSIEWQNGFAITNYVRNNQFEDLIAYNKQELKFGEFYFDGPDNGKKQENIFELKFGGARVSQQNNPAYFNLYQSYVPLYKLEDDGESISYSAASASGASTLLSGFTLDQKLFENSVVRVKDDSDIYTGYYHTNNTATTQFELREKQFIKTSSGKIWRQRIVYNNAGFRVLLYYPNYTISKIGVSPSSSISIFDLTGTNADTTYPVAFYYTPDSQYTFSTELKLGAHPGEIPNSVSIPLSSQYYNRLQKIARNPVINARLRLSESQFNNLDLSEFVYLDIGEWSGYFFVQKIENYDDAQTDVNLELLKVD